MEAITQIGQMLGTYGVSAVIVIIFLWDYVANKKKNTDNEAEDTLKIQIYNTLVKVEKELATTISSIDIWELNGENFEIVTKMRELKDTIEGIKAQCK